MNPKSAILKEWSLDQQHHHYPENLLEMHIHRLHPRPTDSNICGLGNQQICALISPPIIKSTHCLCLKLAQHYMSITSLLKKQKVSPPSDSDAL